MTAYVRMSNAVLYCAMTHHHSSRVANLMSIWVRPHPGSAQHCHVAKDMYQGITSALGGWTPNVIQVKAGMNVHM
jgi:hypothetical protein